MLGRIFDIWPSFCVTWLWSLLVCNVAKPTSVPYRANLLSTKFVFFCWYFR